MQTGKTDVHTQHHRDDELIDRHHPRHPVDLYVLVDQRFETKLVQHGRDWQQATIGCEILAFEIEKRGGTDGVGYALL